MHVQVCTGAGHVPYGKAVDTAPIPTSRPDCNCYESIHSPPWAIHRSLGISYRRVPGMFSMSARSGVKMQLYFVFLVHTGRALQSKFTRSIFSLYLTCTNGPISKRGLVPPRVNCHVFPGFPVTKSAWFSYRPGSKPAWLSQQSRESRQLLCPREP